VCVCVGVCCKLHEHFSHSLLPTLRRLYLSKQEVIKMTRLGGPGQLTGTSYLGHCKTETTGSNPATCMSALNSIINACPVNKPMEDERREEEG
jgi:hypothetical protein